MRFHFIRHGETVRGVNGVYGYSAPLTDLGHAQAAKTGVALARLDVTQVVSSDSTRAIQTSMPLTEALGFTSIIMPELTEINIGVSSDGVTPITENKTPDGRYVMDCAHLGGESWEIFRDRVLGGLTILADRFAEDDVIAVFTHGGVKSVALDHYSGRVISRTMNMQFDNGSISTVELNGDGYVIHTINDIAHLG